MAPQEEGGCFRQKEQQEQRPCAKRSTAYSCLRQLGAGVGLLAGEGHCGGGWAEGWAAARPH